MPEPPIESRLIEAVLHIRRPEMMLKRLAGIFLIERQLSMLARAGIKRVWVTAPEPPARLRLPQSLSIHWDAAPSLEEPARLWVSGNHLFRLDTLKAAAALGSSLDEPPEAAASVRVESREDLRPAMAWLLNGARKNLDGFMARVFDRHLSLSITRFLLDTPMRPNHMTLFSTLIGLGGASQFFYARRGHELMGSLLIWLHTVLDGCDGEMARLTFRESRLGAWLDFWGDNAVHVALFAGLAVDLHGSEPMAMILGTMAILGSLGSALGSVWLAKQNRARALRADFINPILNGVAQLPTPAASVGARLKKLEVLLAQRDFIYLLVACSLLNHEEDFLWAAGLGAPLYLLVMGYIYWSSRPKYVALNSSDALADPLLPASTRS